jgi:hypothetical protein
MRAKRRICLPTPAWPPEIICRFKGPQPSGLHQDIDQISGLFGIKALPQGIPPNIPDADF